jgi:hypothetical protein
LDEQIKQVETVMSEIYVEKWLTFTFFHGLWDIQVWTDSAKPVNAKLRNKTVADLLASLTQETDSDIADCRNASEIGFLHSARCLKSTM